MLEQGQIIRDTCAQPLTNFSRQKSRINDIYIEEGADVDALMEEVGELQDRF